MNNKLKKFRKVGHINYNLKSLEPILFVKKIIEKIFRGKENIHSLNLFRKKLLKCQEIINKANISLTTNKFTNSRIVSGIFLIFMQKAMNQRSKCSLPF